MEKRKEAEKNERRARSEEKREITLVRKSEKNMRETEKK